MIQKILIKSLRRAGAGGLDNYKGGQFIPTVLWDQEKTVAKEAIAPLVEEFNDELQFLRKVYEQNAALARLPAAGTMGVEVIPLSTIEARFKTAIRDQYTRAFILGKRAGGNLLGINAGDMEVLSALRRDEYKFLRGFLDDIRTGGGRMGYEARAEWYANAAREVYWLGFALASDKEDTYIEWFLGKKEHCADCLRLAGTYTRRDFAAMVRKSGMVPQSGKLECRGNNCGCGLREVSKPQ